MPSHRVHLYMDRFYFGRIFPKIHKAMDGPVKFYGRGHRILFHTWEWALFIANKYYPGDRDAEQSALLHLKIDRMCSADPVYKKHLENLAKLDIKQRKKARKNKSQLKKILEKQEKQNRKRRKKFQQYLDEIANLGKTKKKRGRKKRKKIFQLVV